MIPSILQDIKEDGIRLSFDTDKVCVKNELTVQIGRLTVELFYTVAVWRTYNKFREMDVEAYLTGVEVQGAHSDRRDAYPRIANKINELLTDKIGSEL